MRLGDAGRSSVTLRPVGYQFPGAVAGELRDWDANWLVIEGTVSAPDGSGWRFRDPCLTTWEAAGLSRWLRAVVAGTIEPVRLREEPLGRDGSGPEGLLVFTEPTVAVSLADRGPAGVVLRVHLSAQLRPDQTCGATREPPRARGRRLVRR